MSHPHTANVDDSEIAKFSALASRWWDPESEFKPLHAINPLRLQWIESHLGSLQGKHILDIGCGGGILSESMAKLGAHVTGIDLAEKSLKIARLHSLETGIDVTYQHISAEQKAASSPAMFDAVVCMEMLEHVPDPASIIKACSQLVKPGGHVFFSTINRHPKAFLYAIVGAEYILGMLPKGTHHYQKFIKPSELANTARRVGLDSIEFKGMSYHPVTQVYALNNDTSVNYLLASVKS